MLAVIDLGSNTFHLLIARLATNSRIEEVYRERVFVGLSDGGVMRIKQEKIALGLEVCRRFQKTLAKHRVTHLKLVGTAVLRRAANRADFLSECENIFGQSVEIIDGQREAELIFKGVKLMPFDMKSSLIMDIGGGSVEFIFVSQGRCIHAESIEIGVGILHASFHDVEPISKTAKERTKSFVRQHLLHMREFIPDANSLELIGASGSFEIIKELVENPVGTGEWEVDLAAFGTWSETMISLDADQRSAVKGMPAERVKLIVVALILIQETIDFFQPQKLLFSPYALKEGLFFEASQNV